ncbi:MAG: hypothetical protein RBS91_03055 [Sulfurimonadaceae bacterium]|jgi:cellulose biosynthesis protein BcsQ|nr:hypothetical protein [Sulfurimonadaceae bacterium]
MKFKNIVLISTKGGVGKTTIGWHLMPYFLKDREFELIEIDNNNKTVKTFSSSSLLENRMSSFDISAGTEKLEEVVINNMMDDTKINVIDSGGGDGSKAVLNMIEKLKMTDETLFVIPFMPDYAQIENLIDTYKLVHNYQFIVLVNNINLKDDDDMLFVNGDADLEIPDFRKMFKNKFYIVPKSKYFSIAAAKYKETLYDFAKIAFEMEQKTAINLVKEQTNGNRDAMLAILRKYKEADNAKDYLETHEVAELKNFFDKAV